MGWYDAKGDPAARLRQRKYALLRRLQIPPDALSGSLALTHRRCGKPNCRCVDGEGHPVWSLTFRVDGRKRVERIPDEWVQQIRPLVEQGRDCRGLCRQLPTAGAVASTVHEKEVEEEVSGPPFSLRVGLPNG